MPTLTLLILTGLPGAGKTKVAIELCHSARNIAAEVFHICYDELFAHEGKLAWIDYNGSESSWKEFRGQILSCVRVLVRRLLNKDTPAATSVIPGSLRDKFVDKACGGHNVFTATTASKNESYLIVIDDNMYYKSMRYEYYKLAREYQCSFCQVLIDCSPDIAMHRNSSRTAAERVPDHIIVEMNKKIEKPPVLSNDWQEHSLIIDGNHSITQEDLDAIFHLIKRSLDNPVLAVSSAVNPELHLEARLVSSKSQLHQTDLILRRLISIHLKSLDKARVNVKQEAERVNRLKATILKDVEVGAVFTPDSMQEHIRESSVDITNPYFVHIKNVFDDKLAALM